jgi:hypothetical protein
MRASTSALFVGLAAIGLISAPMPGRAAQPLAMPQVDGIASTQSIFVDDPKFGKDPFFPKSTRHLPPVITPAVGVVPDTSAFTQLLNSVVLKGISGLPGKRLALLNNRTLEAGEQTEFKINAQPVKIRLIEIREKSVIIGIEGTAETKEIHLRPGFN